MARIIILGGARQGAISGDTRLRESLLRGHEYALASPQLDGFSAPFPAIRLGGGKRQPDPPKETFGLLNVDRFSGLRSAP